MSISDWSSDVCSSDLDERETVTMIRAVDRLAVQQQPGVTAGLAVAMRAAQIPNAMRDGIPIRRLAEVAPRHRVVGDADRRRVVEGKSECERVDIGGRRIIKKTSNKTNMK